jgi:hypothetical protein
VGLAVRTTTRVWGSVRVRRTRGTAEKARRVVRPLGEPEPTTSDRHRHYHRVLLIVNVTFVVRRLRQVAKASSANA